MEEVLQIRNELERRGVTRTNADYLLHARRSQYGTIGMYASVADGMHFFNRDDFVLTPALGEVAAGMFLEETRLPSPLRLAIMDLEGKSEVLLSTVAAWGEPAHVEADVKSGEATSLSTRWRCTCGTAC